MSAFELDGSGRPVVVGVERKSENDVDISTLEPMVARVAPVAPLVRASTKAGGAPLDTAQVMRDLRARLKVVNAEIRKRKTLESEREQIKRLLDAAKNKKTAPVRAIRAAG